LVRGEAIGLSDEDSWEELKSLYLDADLLKKDVSLDQVFTNEFVEE
jgi:hypothetical protein